MIVVDAQVLLYAALPYDLSPTVRSIRLVDDVWVAPPLWRSEFRNALAGHMRRRSLARRAAERAFADAEELLIEEPRPATSAVLGLVETSPCTAYDLEYVAVARSLDVILVTNDRQILDSFPGTAVSLESFAGGSA